MLLVAAIAYWLLQHAILASEGPGSLLAEAVGQSGGPKILLVVANGGGRGRLAGDLKNSAPAGGVGASGALAEERSLPSVDVILVAADVNDDEIRALVNHAGFDYFDPDAASHQHVRPLFGGRPDADTADADAAERAFQSMPPPMPATFAALQADYDDAQGNGYWRTYLGQFFDRFEGGRYRRDAPLN